MKRTRIRVIALFAATIAGSVAAVAQNKATPPISPSTPGASVAVTASFEHSQIAQVDGNTFWFKGGSVRAAASIYRSLQVAANLTIEHATNVQPGVNVGKTAFMAGPRYTWGLSTLSRSTARGHRVQIFGEGLFGGVRAYDSVFPGSNGTNVRATAFSMQLGGGLDVALSSRFGVRALEADYVHTTLPNNAANSQNDFRIGFGVFYHSR